MSEKAPWSAQSTPTTTMTEATSCNGCSVSGTRMASPMAVGMGLRADAVVVAEAAPLSNMSQTQMAVTAISATETRWRTTMAGLQTQSTKGTNGSSTAQLSRYRMPMS